MRRASTTFCILFSSALGAQVIDTTTIPKELAQAVLGGFGFSGQVPDLVAGRLPDSAYAQLVPPGAMVLGGVVYRRSFGPSSVAVLVTSETPDSALAIVRRHVERGGWASPPTPESRGGFGGVGASDSRLPASFCRDSMSLTVARQRRTLGGSYVTIALGSQRNSACDPRNQQMFRARMGEEDRIQLPSLRAPEDVASSRMGESSSNGNREISAQFETTMGASELVRHFAAQFVAAGWTAGKSAGDADAAIQVFTRKDAKGQMIAAILSDARLGVRTHEVAIKADRRP